MPPSRHSEGDDQARRDRTDDHAQGERRVVQGNSRAVRIASLDLVPEVKRADVVGG